MSQKNFPLDGTVNMKNSLFMDQKLFQNRFQAIVWRAIRGISPYDLIRHALDGLFQQLRDVVEMVIKGIAVYLAAVYNVFYSNFVICLFFQKLPESLDDGIFRTIHVINSQFLMIL